MSISSQMMVIEIYLEARSIILDEVVVTPQKNSYDYVGLKGFFRSYVLFNNEPKYNVDGIVTLMTGLVCQI